MPSYACLLMWNKNLNKAVYIFPGITVLDS